MGRGALLRCAPRVLRDYESAWRARDAAALALLFAEDGFVLSSGGKFTLTLVRAENGALAHLLRHGQRQPAVAL